MHQILRPALIVFALLTLLTGVVYPAIVGAIGAVAFPDQARGSVIERDGKAVGSALLGQPFTIATLLLESAVGDSDTRLQRRSLERQQPGPDEPGARRSSRRADRGVARRRSGK